MSFFDDDEPPRTRTRPRRPATAPGSAAVDAQQLMVRRGVALGVAVLVLLLLVFGVKGCLSNAKEQALKDYSSEVAGVVRDANDNTSTFFETLSGGSESPTDLQTQVNGLRVRAQAQVRQARGLDVPGEMQDAQRTLLLSLGLVEGAIRNVADKLPGALASDAAGAERSVTAIAGQMQAFTAADVVYSQRTSAYIQDVLRQEDVGGQPIQASAFQQNLGWLTPSVVAQRIGAGAAKGAGGGAQSNGPVAPGSHGHGLTSVAVGSVDLQPGGASNRLPATNPTFTVKFANQGDNGEDDVSVRIRVTGGGKPITAAKTVPRTAAGAEASVEVPLGQAPPIGTAVKIAVEVRPVPGEKMTDNNSQEYTALFERG